MTLHMMYDVMDMGNAQYLSKISKMAAKCTCFVLCLTLKHFLVNLYFKTFGIN